MQTYNAMPYLQTPVSPKQDYSPKGGKTDSYDKQDSFSRALDQELAQEPAIDNKQLPAKDDMTAEQPSEGTFSNMAPWLIQIPQIPQHMLGGNPQMPEEVTVLQPEIGTLPIENGAEVLVSEGQMQDGALKMPENTPANGQGTTLTNADAAADVLTMKDFVRGQQANHSAQPQNSNANQQQTEVLQEDAVSLAQPLQTTEMKEEKNTPEFVQVDKPELAHSRNISFEQVKAEPRSNVDMTDIKAGIQKFSEVVEQNIAKGRTEFEIWLEPANLGKLAIKVAYESGKAAISIVCTNEKAMEIMSQNAKNLGAILEQNTGTNTVVVVEHPESDYLQQNAEQENQNSYSQEQQNADGNSDDNDAENQSFLQQLRLGLM